MTQEQHTQKKRSKRKAKSSVPPLNTEDGSTNVMSAVHIADKKKSKNKSATNTTLTLATEAKSKRKSRHNRLKKHSSQIPTSPLLCFDTETTNHGELLELSIFNIQGQELYHQYFRPKATTWPSDIHHITPEMVANCKRFAAHRSEISRIMSGARFFVGCAISNDLSNLRRHGIDIPTDRYTVFETQNWYWLLNDNSDRNIKKQSGLSTMADTYNISFGDKGPHSATADTKTTLNVFRCLVNHFAHIYNNTHASDAFKDNINNAGLIKALSDLYIDFTHAYNDAMHVYKMRNAGGYLCVHRREKGYSIKSHHIFPTDNPNIVMSVKVEDRKSGEIELRKHFENKTLKGLTGIFDLDDNDFEYIRNYTNTIDAGKFISEKKHIHRRRGRILKRSPYTRDTKTDKKHKK